LVIPKKEDASGRKKWRIVVDFRNLNEVTVRNSFPLLVITEILDVLENSKYFSTIDCAMDFSRFLCDLRTRQRPRLVPEKDIFITNVCHTG
jgi:hypothetical protein